MFNTFAMASCVQFAYTCVCAYMRLKNININTIPSNANVNFSFLQFGSNAKPNLARQWLKVSLI